MIESGEWTKLACELNAKGKNIHHYAKGSELVIEEKGLLQLEITAYGLTAHASEPYKGNNPLLKLISLYENLLDIYRMPKDETEFVTSVNLSKLNGGDANNMVPSKATMVLDIRYTKENPPEIIINDIKSLCDGIEVKVLGKDPMFQVDKDLDVIKEFITNAEKVLDRELVIQKCVATSDAIYFSEKNIPTILMNPIGNYWHGPDEYVEIDSLYYLYEIFKSLI
jgi:acetylornithine deacetylase/succinyl-diaminopimelate desuccinylase-like protein